MKERLSALVSRDGKRATQPSPLLIVGLGNPGTQYTYTRHNIGFLILDELCKDLHLSFSPKLSLQADIAETNIDGQKIILAKPTTFMNASGQAVQALAKKFRVEPSRIWVVYDDVAIEFGTLRIRDTGSAGGHNGIKSIINMLGTDAFTRIRCGVGAPPEHFPLDKWVLSRFSESEEDLSAFIGYISRYISQHISQETLDNVSISDTV